MLTELERVLMARLEEKDEESEKADDYYKWWTEQQNENNKLFEEYISEREKRIAAEKRVEELETQIEELSQAKAASVMLTDTAAKGVL